MQTLLRPRARNAFDDEPPSSFLTELLFPLPAVRRTTIGIITWWESRRLLYNAIVGSMGLITLLVVAIADLMTPGSVGPRFGVAMLIPIGIYGLLANLCYSLGALIEVALERVWKDQVLPVGPTLFRQGLAFSVGLTLLPIPFVIFIEMARLINFLFFHW